MTSRSWPGWVMGAVFALATIQAQAGLKKHRPSDAPKTLPEAALRGYVDRVRAQQAAEVRTAVSKDIADALRVRRVGMAQENMSHFVRNNR